jgi:DNA ligase-associated metallophosphoesterase
VIEDAGAPLTSPDWDDAVAPVQIPAGTGLPDGATFVDLAGCTLIADASGVLYWPAEGLLVVADMHLEKGSSFARYGIFLPPYDSAATLARLAVVIARYRPRAVFALGDSFHDGDGPARLHDGDRETLLAMQRGRDWIWIAGNHDPDPAIGIGGSFSAALAIGPIVFRHEPAADTDEAEIAGHLHPVARVGARGRAVSRRCFASNERRMVLPAFGAFTGGLNVRHEAFAPVFGTLGFTAHMLGAARLYSVAGARCLPD